MLRKWYRWGGREEFDRLEDHHSLYRYLREQLSLVDGESCPCADIQGLKVPDPEMPRQLLGELGRILSSGTLQTSKLERLKHSSGMRYEDLLRLRRGILPEYADTVIYPTDEGLLSRMMHSCEANDVWLIPRGGDDPWWEALKSGAADPARACFPWT